MTTREQIVAEARTWISTPYVHQHRAKGIGVDCCGLPIGVGKALGLFPPHMDAVGYSRTPDGKTLLAYCDRWMDRKPLKELQIGDLFVMRWFAHPQHMGIVGDHPAGGFTLIHALGDVRGKGKVVEHRLAAEYPSRAIAAYQFRGIE